MTVSYNEIDAVIPTGKQPMLAQFNAASGAYVNCIGVVPMEFLNTVHYKYVEIEIDVITQRVDGIYDNFKIVDIATAKTKIYETQINNLCKEKIYKRFQPEVQLDILRVALAELCEKLGHQSDALLDMNDYIDDVKRANKVLKQSYITNPDFEFITIEQEQLDSEAKMDGGLHELIGPANLVSLGPTIQQ